MRAFKIAMCLACSSLLAPLWAAEAPVAGTASIVASAVSAVALDGSARVLKKDDAIYSGDRIVTGAAGYVRIGLLDGGSMVLRPNTEFAIESFRFQPGAVESALKVVPPPAKPGATPAPALQVGDQSAGIGNQAFFRLVRGGFRAVSGLVGKINREEYAVRTPVATIGIRGTVFLGVACDAVCAADPVVTGSLPSGEAALGGTVSAVDQGSIVVVSNAAKTAVVETSQVVLTTASGTQVSLPGLPGFLGAENWLNAAQQAAAAPAGPAAPGIASSALSTIPTIGSLAATVLIGAAVLATDTDGGDDGSGTGTTPSGTTPTGTTSTAR